MTVTPEGRIVKNGSTWDFEHNLKDYLGNTLAVIHKGSSGPQPKLYRGHYYPFDLDWGVYPSMAGITTPGSTTPL